VRKELRTVLAYARRFLLEAAFGGGDAERPIRLAVQAVGLGIEGGK